MNYGGRLNYGEYPVGFILPRPGVKNYRLADRANENISALSDQLGISA